ncbi:hypothetical protein FO519_001934 [Halicephalobus sp. NKZ332]|nr:hypothetical protein FO519_001934 [Halicephalobus sp. NKZ332]
MDFLRRCQVATTSFCRSVIEWRSPFTVPYILIVNAIFWTIVFYGNQETHVECLLAVAGTIILWDILLSPTHNRSVASQICYWPIQDLFRTTAFVTSMAAVRQLKMGEEEQAFWLACLSLFSLLTGPVYKYNQITAKIFGFFRGIFDCISYVFYLIVVNPASKFYEGLKYVFLLKWVPALLQYLRSFGSYIYQTIDNWFLQYIRTMGNRVAQFFEYWIYFHWWTDLRAWSRNNVYNPIAHKLAVLKDGFVYVFGGYWFYPALQFTGRQLKKASIVVLGWANQLAIMVGNSVLWPVAVVCYQQLKEVYLIFHRTAVQPVIDVLYVRYEYVEDMAYIYVLGPFYDSDTEFKDYIPDMPSRAASDSEFSNLSPQDSDDEFAIGLQGVNISGSESDEDEFSIMPRRRRRPRPAQ